MLICLAVTFYSFAIPLYFTCFALLSKENNAELSSCGTFEFLVSYWVIYYISTMLELRFMSFFSIISVFPLSLGFQIAFGVFKAWLFYCHGCLVIFQIFLAEYTERMPVLIKLKEYDDLLWFKNCCDFLSSGSFCKILTMLTTHLCNIFGTEDQIIDTCNAKRTLFDANECQVSVSLYLVKRVCYVDAPKDLFERYLSFRPYERHVISAISKLTKSINRIMIVIAKEDDSHITSSNYPIATSSAEAPQKLIKPAFKKTTVASNKEESYQGKNSLGERSGPHAFMISKSRYRKLRPTRY